MKENKKYYIFEMKMGILNVLSIVLLITCSLLTLLIYKIFNIDFIFIFNNQLGIILLTYLIYMILHEILHSVGYILFGADPSKITFGAHLEKGILCCLCKQNISRKNILNSLLFPFFYLGIVTYIIGIIFNNHLLVILSILNISGCIGDLVMFKFFIKLKNIEYSEFDNPIRFAVYSKEDLSKVNPYGLKYIETLEKIERNDLKRLKISKLSYLCFFILILLTIVLLFL